VGFYLFGSVPEPFTTYCHIRALPAGTTLVVDRIGAHEPRRYHSVAQVYCDAEVKAEGLRSNSAANRAGMVDEVRQALLDSVRAHLVADVPVGVFLSGGIDSGALVGLMRDAGQHDIEAVTLAFGEFRGRPEDEAPLADEVARLYGARHTIRFVTPAEFEADLPRIIEAMDQPSIDGVNTWYVSKAAREFGLKVALSGLGGDELLGGYPSFRDIPRWVRLLGPPARLPLLGKAARVTARPLVAAIGASPKAAGMLELGGSYPGAYLLRRGLFMPWELGRMLAPDVVAEGLRRLAPLRLIGDAIEPRPRSAYAKVAALEASLYMRNQLLRDTDWSSMANGLEVRVPLVDHVLLRTVATTACTARSSAGVTKANLALSPSTPLPDRVVSRAKTGFTTPIGSWLQSGSPTAAVPVSEASWRPRHWARQWAERLAAK
jgi:asparagine synthase (glutamine-hydrolysing)